MGPEDSSDTAVQTSSQCHLIPGYDLEWNSVDYTQESGHGLHWNSPGGRDRLWRVETGKPTK